MALPKRLLTSFVLPRTYAPVCCVETLTGKNSFRRCSTSDATFKAEKWILHGAVCLHRYPKITKQKTEFQKIYFDYLQQFELAKSKISDHELKLKKDVEIAEQQKEGKLEVGNVKQNILSTKDIEALWLEELQATTFAPRDTGETSKKSPNRDLDKTLILVVKQKVGNKVDWRLPCVEWEKSESMKQTAARALKTHCGDSNLSVIKCNAPDAFFKYRFSKKLADDVNASGVKTFIYKADFVEGNILPSEDIEDYAWISKEEIPQYLPSVYAKTCQTIVLDIE